MEQVGRIAAVRRPLGREHSTDLLDLEEYGETLLSMPSGDFRHAYRKTDDAFQEDEPQAQMVRAMRVHPSMRPDSAKPCNEVDDRRKAGRTSRFGVQQVAPQDEPHGQQESCYSSGFGHGYAGQARSPVGDGRFVPRDGNTMRRTESLDEPATQDEVSVEASWRFSDSSQGQMDGNRGACVQEVGSKSQGHHNKTMRRNKAARSRTGARVRREASQKGKSGKVGISDITGDDFEDEEDFLTSVPPAAQDVLLGEPGHSSERVKQRWQSVTLKVRMSVAPEKFHSPSSWERSDWLSQEDAVANRPASASAVTPSSTRRSMEEAHSLPPRSCSTKVLQDSAVETPRKETSVGGTSLLGSTEDVTALARENSDTPQKPGHITPEAEEEFPDVIRRVLSAGKVESARLAGEDDTSDDPIVPISRSKTTPVAGDFAEEEAEEEEEGHAELEEGELLDEAKAAGGDAAPAQLARNLSLPHAASIDGEDAGAAALEEGLERNLSLQGQASNKKAPKAGVGAMMRLSQLLGKKPGTAGGSATKGGAAGRMRPPKPLMNLPRSTMMRQNSSDFKEFADLPAPKRVHFQLSELQLATDNFNQRNILGVGGFGTVYFGSLPVKPAEEVAIKVLKKTGSQADEEFKIELELLSRLEHKHLVKLFGFCWTTKDRLLVYEYMRNGSLYDHLHGKKREENGPLSWDRRLRIAVGAARGLRYLHAQRPQILHRDIKAANILLTEKLQAKVADFGCAKLIRQTVMVENEETGEVVERLVESVDVAMGTHGLMAPEILMTGEVSAAGDIYSFGVVLLELISGLQPIMNGGKQLASWAQPLLDQGKWDELVDPCILDQRGGVAGVTGYGFKAKVSENSSLVKCAQLAKACICYDALARPSMDEVAHALQIIYFEKDAPAAQPQQPPSRPSSSSSSIGTSSTMPRASPATSDDDASAVGTDHKVAEEATSSPLLGAEDKIKGRRRSSRGSASARVAEPSS